MNFSQAVQAVIAITKRPDKLAETERAVNYALSFYIIKGEFDRDLLETSLSLPLNSYSGQLSLSSLTRFRRMRFVNPIGSKIFLRKIAPEHLFVPGNTTQTNLYYITGFYINYVMNITATALNLGYYSFPATLTASDTHWFLDVASACVIDRAAAIIFKAIGDDSSMKSHFGFADEFYNAFVRDSVQP